MTPTISIKAGCITVSWVGYLMHRRPRRELLEWIYQVVLPGVDRAQEHILQYATATQYKTGVEVTIPGGEDPPAIIRLYTGPRNQEILSRQIDRVRCGLATGKEHLGVMTPPC